MERTMPAATHSDTSMPLSRSSVAVWSLHLLCFVLPLTCVLFLATAPHSPLGAFAWWSVLAVSVWLDMRGASERRQPLPTLPGWPFDAVLYVLAALQLCIVAAFVHMVTVQGFWHADTLAGVFLVGINSGYSGIVVAHELIHRPQGHMQTLGRIVLGSVLYEHFFTEHVRGHHSRVGTPSDPATARFGETSIAFFRRTVPRQLRSAWRLEAKRIGDERMGWRDRRTIRNRVAQGLVLEWGTALAVLAACGLGPFVVYCVQALVAVRLLEAVNYFEHWGLTRPTGKRVRTIDSWDTDSWFTLYTLVGLSRHADHHAHAARPYQQLRHFDESPKLPYGYFGSVVMAIFRNGTFRAQLTTELERRRLGPFESDVAA
jgi:alkane 1-monooxygenase